VRTNKILLLFLFCQVTFCQTGGEKLLHGKIVVESGNVGGVTIINLVNEKTTVSDGNGDFFILAKADDLLVLSAVNLDYYRRIIEDEYLKSDVLSIKMTAKITELEGVIVNKHPEISAVSLGISPKGMIHRTQMERRLYTAGDFKPIHLLGLLGGSLQVDPIFNAINGRTAMLEKSIEIENKERLLRYIGALFDDEYYTNTLKIPANYIKGFQHYCIEKEEVATYLRSKNKAKIKLLIVSMAEKYNKIIADEN
jgi:hypothetical protein